MALSVITKTANPDDVCIDIAEALRYMGYKHAQPDQQTFALLQDCLSELKNAVSYTACLCAISISVRDDEIDFGFLQIKSRDLSKNLSGCDRAVLFAATIGAGADRLIAKYGKIQPSRALILDALGSAAIEGWCNLLNEQVRAIAQKNNRFLRPRFSAGYGDFPIAIQPQLLTALDARRKAGIYLTDSCMMLPTKSVSAVIGVSDRPKACKTGCEICSQTECAYKA